MNAKITLIAASLVLLVAACAAPAPSARPAKVVPPPQDVTLAELDAAIENGKQIQNEKGEEVICRKEAKTGSRLARETICMTRAEWLRVSEESQRATRKSMRQGRIPHGT